MAPHNMHFSPAEFSERQEKTRDALADQGLDGMLIFKIEDMYWLCGFDSDGFSIFHAMFIGADGELYARQPRRRSPQSPLLVGGRRRPHLGRRPGQPEIQSDKGHASQP